MPRLAAVLYLVLLVVAVAWRSWLQFRLTGDHGLRSLPADGTAAERGASTLLIVAALLTFLSPLLVLVRVTAIPDLLKQPALHVAGAVLALAGILIIGVAQVQMGASWRIGVDRTETTALVTGGFFAIVRNPIYTGIFTFGAGLLLLVPTFVTLLGALIGLISVHVHVRFVEEPFLAELHGEAYREYASRVGRFLPRLGRLLRRPQQGRAV